MKIFKTALTLLLVAIFALFAMASGSSDTTTVDQGSDVAANVPVEDSSPVDQGSDIAVSAPVEDTSSLGDYSIEIDSCRLAYDFEGKEVVIVKYIFTNVSDDSAAAFYLTFEDSVYQNGVGLNESYFVDDSANYSSDNQMKEIKQGATLEVEVAYELNDTETDIEVEISELFSFDDKVITKTFSIVQ